MLRLSVAVLYTALAIGANAARADIGAAEALREGDMRKLAFHQVAIALPDIMLVDGADVPVSLADWRGQWVVLNFWATWCAPCRKEMPALDALQGEMGAQLAVVPVATGRNSVQGIEKFFAEAGVTRLPVLRDPRSALARAMGVMGLPVTVIVNPEGQEVARLIGDADWNSNTARAVLAALMAR